MQMDWLITSLLKLSRLDAGVVVFQRGPVDVNGLIRSSLCPFLITMDLHRIIVQVDAPEESSFRATTAGLCRQSRISSKTAWKAQATTG